MLLFIFSFIVVGFGWQSDLPFWPKYSGRSVSVLTGSWNFAFLGGEIDLASLQDDDVLNTPTPLKINVPGVFDNSIPGTLGIIGTAIYRTSITITPNSHALLYFAGCGFYCRVWVDQVSLADHRNSGYSPFWIDVPPSASQTRILTVLVDNRYSDKYAPLYTGGDFYNYGGIHREVVLHELKSDEFIRRIEVTPTNLTSFSVTAYVQTNRPKININCVLTDQNKRTTYITIANLDVSSNCVTFSIQDSMMLPWSPESPNLQILSVSLGSDSVMVRFGMRILGKDNGRFTLNGEVVKLLGVNRHTLYPETGSTMNTDQMEQDIRLLKEMNVNYVRGAHYPQDQKFLDRCDEEGIMIWEETLGPGVANSNLVDEAWLQHEVDQINEMISASFNHPSVIFWGFYNEADDTIASSCDGYKAAADAVRARDKSRFVTYASFRLSKGLCYEHADVISFNGYPGWYISNLDHIAEWWKNNTDWVKSKYPDKPFTISETGAGGVYEWKNDTAVRWSQNYQAEVVRANIEYVLSDERVSGLTIWQFADIKANRDDSKKCTSCEYQNGPCGWTEVSTSISCDRALTISTKNLGVSECGLNVALNPRCLNSIMIWSSSTCQCIPQNHRCKLVYGSSALYQYRDCRGPLDCKYIDVKCHRPGGENHKGQVDFWRRPKKSFHVVQKLFGHHSLLQRSKKQVI